MRLARPLAIALAIPAVRRAPTFRTHEPQNWQSEFLSVAVLVLLSIVLRERGSPQSKPVAASHAATGES